MHAMQYEITLPADHDMTIIRRRVATRGSGTDAFPGLGVKTYAIRERDVLGSPVNQYAPFYLWADPAGMNGFLFGAPFAGLSADFGRPVVRHWMGVAFRPGPAWDARPTAATRTAAGCRRTIRSPTSSMRPSQTWTRSRPPVACTAARCWWIRPPGRWCTSASEPNSQRRVRGSATRSCTSRPRTCGRYRPLVADRPLEHVRPLTRRGLRRGRAQGSLSAGISPSAASAAAQAACQRQEQSPAASSSGSST